MGKIIDLNCDLGEWSAEKESHNDRLIMPFISSCNIACGGHAGSEYSIRETIRIALEYEVAIGAHPGYADPVHFGRKELNLRDEELAATLESQLQRFKAISEDMNVIVHHVKPHGALYNQAAVSKKMSEIIADIVKKNCPGSILYGPPESELEGAANRFNIPFYKEVFADRTYENDLSLRNRKLKRSVIHQPKEVIAQVQNMLHHGFVITYSGIKKEIKADTICLHSDTKGAIELAAKINEYLRESDVRISADK